MATIDLGTRERLSDAIIQRIYAIGCFLLPELVNSLGRSREGVGIIRNSQRKMHATDTDKAELNRPEFSRRARDSHGAHISESFR